jgi:uncharacterized protein with HEPN domain
MKDDRVYLLEIQERIRRINEFVADGESAFQNSLLIQDAVIRNFEVIGQAVKDILIRHQNLENILPVFSRFSNRFGICHQRCGRLIPKFPGN